MLWRSCFCHQSCCGRFSSRSQVSRGKDVVPFALELLFIVVGIHIYAHWVWALALVLQLSVIVELLPLSGVPNGSLIVAVSVLPRNLVSTKPRLCIKALTSNTKEGSVASWRIFATVSHLRAWTMLLCQVALYDNACGNFEITSLK